MPSAPRQYLSHASFVLLLAANVTILTVLLLNQWLEMGQGWLWLLAAGIAMALMPILLRLADALFARARAHRNVPLTGESFP